MSQPFIGMIALFPYNFAPRGWAFCYGQILSIAQNTALFSLLGTTFGGNGQTTFALPDLQGRVPIGAGQGPGLAGFTLGQVGGTETATLVTNNLPAHTHVITLSNLKATANVSNGPGNTRSAVGSVLASEAAGVTAVYSTQPPTPNAAMADSALTVSGSATAANAGSG